MLLEDSPIVGISLVASKMRPNVKRQCFDHASILLVFQGHCDRTNKNRGVEF